MKERPFAANVVPLEAGQTIPVPVGVAEDVVEEVLLFEDEVLDREEDVALVVELESIELDNDVLDVKELDVKELDVKELDVAVISARVEEADEAGKLDELESVLLELTYRTPT